MGLALTKKAEALDKHHVLYLWQLIAVRAAVDPGGP